MFSFIYVNLRATFFRIFESIRVIFTYYRNLNFLLTDLLLHCLYVFKNPHRISKSFLRKKGEKNVYGYGETPLTTLDKICKECRILSKDIVFDLGCGTGRTSFWLKKFVKCHVVAIDYLPTFIMRANQVKRLFPESKLQFLEKDMQDIDFGLATVVYLYGTCLKEKTIERLIEKFISLKPGSKIITVSYPLTEYNASLFRLEKSFFAHFPWGKAEIFLNIRQL